MDNSMIGGWSVNPDLAPCSLPQDVATLFTEVVGSLLGAKYEPLMLCGSQIVSGVNYMFICKQTMVIPDAPIHLVKLTIYKPIQGKGVITDITRIL